MNKKPSIELIGTLTQRWEIVRLLRSGVSDKRGLTEAASVSRPTVDRALRKLSKLGLLQTNGSNVELTPFGEVVIDEYLQFEQRCATFQEICMLVPELPEGLDVVSIADSDPDVNRVEGNSPHEFLSHIDEIINHCDDIFAVLPVLHPHLLEYLKERTLNGNLSLTLIAPEKYKSDSVTLHGKRLEEMFDLEQHTIVFSKSSPDVGYVLFDDRNICIIVYKQGSVEGMITLRDQNLVHDIKYNIENIISNEGSFINGSIPIEPENDSNTP